MNSSGESAAREQWIGMSAREVWLNLPESCAVTEPFIAAIIARHYAKRAREEWIPVSEWLPERSGDVLIAGHAFTYEGGHKVLSVEAAFFNGHTRLFWVPENDGDTKRAAAAATHWRPLPAAPFAAKGETE